MTTFESYGAVDVAACASLSFISTLSLGCFIAFLVLKYRGIDTSSMPASTGIRFLRSQAGYLFVHLLAADFTQALGFGLSWVWARSGQIDSSRHICTFQALAIEAGDVASAVFSLYIALHTAAMLTMEKKANETFLRVACTCAWIFVAVVTAMGPLAIATHENGSFYAAAGNWCWISDAYKNERLSLHYLFIFISAAGQLTSYLAIFIIIRFGITIRKPKLSDIEDQDQSRDSTPRTPINEKKETLKKLKTQPSIRPMTSSSVLRRKLDKTSLLMLLYPLVNLAVILPLSVFRLAGLAGQHGSPQALAVCGCIFALGGLANTILYSFSRRILSFHVRKCTVVAVATPLTDVDSQARRAFTIAPFGTPASDMTRVNTAPSTPYNYNSEAANKLRELRLSSAGSSKTSLNEVERPPSALLPAMKYTTRDVDRETGTISRPVSRHSAQPFSDMTLVKVDQQTVIRSEK